MHQVRIKKIILSFLLLTLLIFSDQITKYIIRHWGGFYICNEGIAFGISGIGFFVVLLIAITLSVWILSSVIESKSSKSKLISGNYLPITIVFSGAISNLVDRIIFGCVIDFIDLKFWPVFNLADIFIVFGVLMFLIKNRKE